LFASFPLLDDAGADNGEQRDKQMHQQRVRTLTLVLSVAAALILAGCAESVSTTDNQQQDSCLYRTKENGRFLTKWAPCNAPPPRASSRMTGDGPPMPR
jgi:uncharacterized protein YceK